MFISKPLSALALVSLTSAAAITSAPLPTFTMPVGWGHEDRASIVAVDKGTQLTTYMLELPYVHPMPPALPQTWDRSAEITQGPSTYKEHFSIHETHSGKATTIGIGFQCEFQPGDKYATCSDQDTTLYDGVPATTSSSSARSEYIQNYIITVTGGAEKLAPTAAPQA